MFRQRQIDTKENQHFYATQTFCHSIPSTLSLQGGGILKSPYCKQLLTQENLTCLYHRYNSEVLHPIRHQYAVN